MYFFSLWLIPCLTLLLIIVSASSNCRYPQYSPNLKYSQTGVKQIKRVKIPQNTSQQDYNLTNLTASITFSTSLTTSQLSYAAILRNLYDINPQNGLSINIKVSSITNTSLNLQISAHYYNDITLLTVSYLLIVKDQQIQQNLLVFFNQKQYQNSQAITNTSQTVYFGYINPLINTNVVIVGWLSGISIQMTASTIQLITRIQLIDNFILKFTLQTYRALVTVIKKVSHTVIVYNPTALKRTKIKLQIISGVLKLLPLNSNRMQLQAKQFNVLLGIYSFAYRTADFSAFGFETLHKTAYLQFFYTSYYNEVPYLIVRSYYCAHQYQYYFAAANRCFSDCPLPAVNNIVDLACDGKVDVDSSDCQAAEDTWMKTFIIAFSISFVICFAIAAYFIKKKCNLCKPIEAVNQDQGEMKDQTKKDQQNPRQTETKLKEQLQQKDIGSQHDEQKTAHPTPLKKQTSFELKRLNSSKSDYLSPFPIPNIINPIHLQNPVTESEKDETIQHIV